VKVAIVVSVSDGIADIARLTMPNKLEYALRHGYSLFADNQPYAEAIRNTTVVCWYLDRFDLVWTLDADAVITNMGTRVETLDCLGPHATVCEEDIVSWNRLNCGSVIWRDTRETRQLLRNIQAAEHEWHAMPCGWQTWLAQERIILGGALSVAPCRSFNSCAWNKPAGSDGEPGSHWQPGDFVFHPCGVFPMDERARLLASVLEKDVQR